MGVTRCMPGASPAWRKAPPPLLSCSALPSRATPMAPQVSCWQEVLAHTPTRKLDANWSRQKPVLASVLQSAAPVHATTAPATPPGVTGRSLASRPPPPSPQPPWSLTPRDGPPSQRRPWWRRSRGWASRTSASRSSSPRPELWGRPSATPRTPPPPQPPPPAPPSPGAPGPLALRGGGPGSGGLSLLAHRGRPSRTPWREEDHLSLQRYSRPSRSPEVQ